MNPMTILFKEILASKLILCVITLTGGLLIEESFPFLAKVLKVKPEHTVSMETIIRAKKEKEPLVVAIDSITKQIDKHPPKETVYRTINEKVDRITRNATNAQLDSILTNYRYTPFTKAGDSERFNRFR
jgi:hypothetical protein